MNGEQNRLQIRKLIQMYPDLNMLSASIASSSSSSSLSSIGSLSPNNNTPPKQTLTNQNADSN